MPEPVLEGRPEVIVDVVVCDGLFSLQLRNIGPRPALDVTTTFDVPITGLGGTRRISTLRLFQTLPFIAPGKLFEQFVDPLATYVARREPLRFTATVTYRDRGGREYKDAMTHDLRVYLELGQVRCVASSAPSRGSIDDAH